MGINEEEQRRGRCGVRGREEGGRGEAGRGAEKGRCEVWQHVTSLEWGQMGRTGIRG